MRFSAAALVAAIASVATASILPFSGHQVVADDAIGTFRIAGVMGLGCPNRIQHTETVNADSVIPHTAMRHNRGIACSEGEMSIFLSAEDAMDAVESQTSKDFITNFTVSDEPAVYGVEETGRTCGSTSFGAGTVVILFTPAETLSLSDREAFPAGSRYMIIDDPATPGTCTFQAPLRQAETPEPPAPTPAGEDGDRDVPSGGGDGDGSGPTPEPDTPSGGGGGAGVRPPGATGGGSGNGDNDEDPENSEDEDEGTVGNGTSDGFPGSDGDGAGEPSMEPSPEASTETEGEGGEEDDGSVCFPADAQVEIEDGTTKKISDVQIGDRVKVANGMYSDVFMFTHKDATTVHDFVTLSTASGDKISATRGHYLYINGQFSAAMSAKVGDVLELGNGARTTIKQVAVEKKVGLFNPQTVHGDIIVNSVRASTFTRTIEPQTAQALLAPLRMMYSAIGVSASFLNNGADSIAALLPKGQAAL